MAGVRVVWRRNQSRPETSGSTTPHRIGVGHGRTTGGGGGQQTIDIGGRREEPNTVTGATYTRFRVGYPRSGAKAPVRQQRSATGQFTDDNVGRRPAAGLRRRCRPRHEGRSGNHETDFSADVSGPARRALCRQKSGRSFDEHKFEPVVAGADRRRLTVCMRPVASGSILAPVASHGTQRRPTAAAAGSACARRRPHSASGRGVLTKDRDR